jgi:hypothetical protein
MNNNSILTPFNQDGLELMINNATGEVFASQNALAKMCNCESSDIRRLRRSIPETIKITTSRGIQECVLCDKDLILTALDKYGGVPEARAYFNLPPRISDKLSRSKSKSPEQAVIDKLISNHKKSVKLEVPTKYGRIDILTSEYIIEVKEYGKLHHALGQILAYSKEYPNHQKLVVCFGERLRTETDLSHWIDLYSDYAVQLYLVTDKYSYKSFQEKYFEV